MDLLLLLVNLVATLLIWVGGFFFVRWLMRRSVEVLGEKSAAPGGFDHGEHLIQDATG